MTDPTAQEYRRKWEKLGREDPLWAILTDPVRKGGKWNPDEFFATGDADVARYRHALREAGAPERFGAVLDFGCGVGRLTRAWARHADSTTGVDISDEMIRRGRELNAGFPDVRFLHNEEFHLRQIPDASFDLVFSLITLQHIPPPHSLEFIAEFGRVCRPGGWVAFQVPARHSSRSSYFRQRIVDGLPFGFGRWYRRLKEVPDHGFEMHVVSPADVERAAARGGLHLVRREPNDAAGAAYESFLYLFRKDGGTNPAGNGEPRDTRAGDAAAGAG